MWTLEVNVDISTPYIATYHSSRFCVMGNIYLYYLTDSNCQWGCRRFVMFNVVLRQRAINLFRRSYYFVDLLIELLIPKRKLVKIQVMCDPMFPFFKLMNDWIFQEILGE